jgi:hypothetical protein
MLARMSIPPNRIAVVTGLLSAVVAALSTLLGAVDTLPKALVVCVALLVVAVVLVVYLLGWQKHENLIAHGRVTIDQVQEPADPQPDPVPEQSVPDPSPPLISTPVATSTARAPGPGQAPFENGDLEPTLIHLPTSSPDGVVDVGDAKSVKA